MTQSTIGENIRTFRVGRLLTQKDLAERVGVSPQAVSKWEKGICCPDILLLPVISEIMGVPIDRFFHANHPAAEKL